MPKESLQAVRDGFAARLAEAIHEAGLEGSLRDMASAIGVSKSFLDDMLKGDKLPGRNRSLRIAGALGVREEWLMDGIPPMRRPIVSMPIDHWEEQDKEALLATWRAINNKYNNPRGEGNEKGNNSNST